MKHSRVEHRRFLRIGRNETTFKQLIRMRMQFSSPASQLTKRALVSSRCKTNFDETNDANASSLQSLDRTECVTQAIQPSLLTQNFEVI